MVVTGMSSRPRTLDTFPVSRETPAGPMLCAGNELATAASKALGADMKFENISQSVPSTPMICATCAAWFHANSKADLVSGPRPSEYSKLSQRAIDRSCNTYWIISAWSARARPTISPRRHFMMSRENTPPNRTISSACTRMRFARAKGPSRIISRLNKSNPSVPAVKSLMPTVHRWPHCKLSFCSGVDSAWTRARPF